MHAFLRIVTLTLSLAQGVAAHGQTLVALEERPQHQVNSSNQDSAWRPTEGQRQAVEVVTRDYFALRDSGKTKQAYALVSPRQKQYMPESTFARLLEEFNAKAGAPQGRSLRKITWYKDTPQSGSGLYVAVDFASGFENLALHCGYIVWHEQPDGSFLQVREEVNVIDTITMAKLKPEQLATVRAQFDC